MIDSHGTPASVSRPSDTPPREFSAAVESLRHARLRPEITLRTIRPPERLAPFSHGVGLEVVKPETSTIPVNSDGDAFGRLILLHDPNAVEAWGGSMRLVAYIQADMDDSVASDPLLPDVAWQWLQEGLGTFDVDFNNLGGTVTSTSSRRFGDMAGTPPAHQIELRSSWTASGDDLENHLKAFAHVLANVAGLPPEGVVQLRR